MKIATTTVSSEGMCKERGNESRLQAYRLTLPKLREHNVRLICLPGGFFYATSNAYLEDLACKCVEEAKRNDIAVALGIDLSEKILKRDLKKHIQNGSLPWFGICWNPNEDKLHMWPQRSFTSENQWWLPDKFCQQERTMQIDRSRIEILVCGEIFNQRIRSSIINRLPKIDAVIDLAHTSLRFRVHAAMKVLAKAGVTSFCSVHASVRNAMKYCYIAGGKKKSTRNPDIVVGDNPRIEIKIWDI